MLTFDFCRYRTHLRWAEGNVETEDALLPYPKKVKSSTTDVRLSLPVTSRTVVAESVSSTEKSPTASAVSRHLTENRDMWAACNSEESEAFWGFRCSRAVDEQTCTEVVGNVADAVAESAAEHQTAAQAACNIEQQASNKRVGSINSYTADSISISAQDSSGKNLTNSVAEAVSAAAVNIVEDAGRQTELSSQNFDNIVKDNIFVAPADSVSEANILSTTGCSCYCHTDSDIDHTVSIGHCQHCQRLGCPVDDDINVDMTGTSDADDISADKLCVDNDSDADTYIVDDTEDSDVDEDFIASRPSWQTVLKKDPFPVKEHLLLSLEEVACFTILSHYIDEVV